MITPIVSVARFTSNNEKRQMVYMCPKDKSHAVISFNINARTNFEHTTEDGEEENYISETTSFNVYLKDHDGTTNVQPTDLLYKSFDVFNSTIMPELGSVVVGSGQTLVFEMIDGVDASIRIQGDEYKSANVFKSGALAGKVFKPTDEGEERLLYRLDGISVIDSILTTINVFNTSDEIAYVDIHLPVNNSKTTEATTHVASLEIPPKESAHLEAIKLIKGCSIYLITSVELPVTLIGLATMDKLTLTQQD